MIVTHRQTVFSLPAVIVWRGAATTVPTPTPTPTPSRTIGGGGGSRKIRERKPRRWDEGEDLPRQAVYEVAVALRVPRIEFRARVEVERLRGREEEELLLLGLGDVAMWGA